MKNSFKLIACLALPLAVGAVSGWITRSGVENWFITINKPSFNPPNWIFAPVWTFLYILMGISFYLILRSPETYHRKRSVFIFVTQLILNFFWSIIFFGFKLPGLALIEIIILWTVILAMIILFYKISKRAALLQLPYLAWVSFATVLNAAIFYLNA